MGARLAGGLPTTLDARRRRGGVQVVRGGLQPGRAGARGWGRANMFSVEKRPRRHGQRKIRAAAGQGDRPRWESYERESHREGSRAGTAAERARPRERRLRRGRDGGRLRNYVKDHLDDRSGAVVYVGRRMPAYELAASPLANPYEVGRDGSRDEVRDKYRAWLRTEFATQGSPARDELLRIRDLSLSGADVALSYWATGNECHADIVREAVLKLAERERAREQIINGRDGQSREDGARERNRPDPAGDDSWHSRAAGGMRGQQSNHVPSPAFSPARADVLAYSPAPTTCASSTKSPTAGRAEHASYLNERSSRPATLRARRGGLRGRSHHPQGV